MIAGTIDAVESVKAIMLWKYKMKDLGKIHLTLGCEVLYDEATVQTPMSEYTLTKEMSPTTDQQKLETTKITYRQVVGSLLWLVTGSRVDIAFAVTCCAKYLSLIHI